MESYSYREDSGSRSVEASRSVRRQTSYRESGKYTHPTDSSYEENRFISQSGRTDIVCTLCREILQTQSDIQAHLASPMHLDMVVRYPTLPLQDILIPEHHDSSFNLEQNQDHSFTLEQNQDHRGIFTEFGSSMTQAVDHLIAVSCTTVEIDLHL